MILPLPAIPGVQTLDWRLERNVAVASGPLGRTMQRQVRSGDLWAATLNFPPYRNEDAGVLTSWLSEASRGDRWIYLSPPQSQARGAWAPTERVGNGRFLADTVSGWTGAGAALSVNARRLKVRNTGNAVGTATVAGVQVEANQPHVLLVDLYEGSTSAWRVRILNDADGVEEHVSYYTRPGRVPIVFVPSSSAVRVELACNTPVSGDDVKFGDVSVARCLVLDGDNPVGRSMKVKGGPISSNGALKAGEFITVQLWNGWQLVQLKEDFDTDASGKGRLRFEPALRSGAVGPVIVHRPFVRMFIPAHRAASSISPPIFHGVSVEVQEDVTALQKEIPQDTDLIYLFDANSFGVAPVVGTGTPTVTRAGTATYVDSTGVIKAAAANTPRLDYDPVTLANNGMWIEAQRTNLILQSNNLTASPWAGTDSTTTLRAGISARGLTDLFEIKEGTAANEHNRFQSVSLAANAAYTLSAHFKKGTRRYMVLGASSPTHYPQIKIDLDSRTATEVYGPTNVLDAASITFQEIGDGECRVSGKFTTTVAESWNVKVGLMDSVGGSSSYTGDGVSYGYAGGLQVEPGGYPSSYIDTTTAAVTRNLDDIYALLGQISGFNPGAMTLVAEWSVPSSGALSSYPTFASINDGTESNRVQLGSGGGVSEGARAFVLASGVEQFTSQFGAASANTVYRSAIAATTNDAVAAFNGTFGTVDTAVTMPSGLNRFTICNTASGGNPLNGHLRRLWLYKARKPNRQILSMTL